MAELARWTGKAQHPKNGPCIELRWVVRSRPVTKSSRAEEKPWTLRLRLSRSWKVRRPRPKYHDLSYLEKIAPCLTLQRVQSLTWLERSDLCTSTERSSREFSVDVWLQNELETSIMLSKPPAAHPAMPTSRRGTSLTLLTRTKNPSQLVRALYLAPELAPHPMLSGATAEAIGSELGIETIDSSYFWTEWRWREHRRGLGLPEEPVEYPNTPDSDSDTVTEVSTPTSEKFDPLDLMPTGTVGAVALDVRGCIVAVTSTGGRTNKLVGRIGDTPVMGSGFWAEEWKREGGVLKRTWDRLRGKSTCEGVGVSGTGDGDVRRTCLHIIEACLNCVSSTISARMSHRRLHVACNTSRSPLAKQPNKL
jgi:hypothetical protein